MNILVTGSLSYDIIMSYDGEFEATYDKRMGPKNISFVIDSKEKEFGGSGGNIAYTLGLLGEQVDLHGRAGRDFADYEEWLIENSVNTDYVTIHDDIDTAIAYIATDKKSNQITSFYPGAMLKQDKFKLSDPGLYNIAIISPENASWVSQVIDRLSGTVPYIFDPGQQISALTKSELLKGVKGAEVLIGNELEIEALLSKIGISFDKITSIVPHVIVTKGKRGSVIYNYSVPRTVGVAKSKRTLDQTGAGDAYRAGILTGLACGFDWQLTAEIAATAASFAVEEMGTQNHFFELDEFNTRLKRNFGKEINLED